MTGEIQRLVGSQNTSLGVSITGSTARKTRREIEQLAARTEVAVMTEQASAFAHSVALSNMAALVSQAEAHLNSTPGAGEYLHSILANYAVSASQRLSRGL